MYQPETEDLTREELWMLATIIGFQTVNDSDNILEFAQSQHFHDNYKNCNGESKKRMIYSMYDEIRPLLPILKEAIWKMESMVDANPQPLGDEQ